MTKRKALGSGLDSLLSGTRNVVQQDYNEHVASSLSLPIHKIVRNRHQPRKSL